MMRAFAGVSVLVVLVSFVAAVTIIAVIAAVDAIILVRLTAYGVDTPIFADDPDYCDSPLAPGCF